MFDNNSRMGEFLRKGRGALFKSDWCKIRPESMTSSLFKVLIRSEEYNENANGII
jgi:hypothetical protein